MFVLANFHPHDGRVMIASPRINGRRPVIHMYMLDLDSAVPNGLRHKHMVQLLVVLIEDIRIPLHGRDVGNLVYLEENIGEGRKNRASHDELVAVPASNNTSALVFSKNGLHELLFFRVDVRDIQNDPKKKTYCNGIDLTCSLVHPKVRRRPRIPLVAWASALRCQMKIDCEESLAFALR